MTTSTLTRRVGQRVLVTGGKFHGAAVIEKVNPKNLIIKMEIGGQRINCHPSFLSDLAADADVPTRYGAVTAVDLPTQQPGSLVRVRGLDGVYVVLADKFDKINVARLGGDGGRYYRALRKDVQPLPADEVASIKIVVG